MLWNQSDADYIPVECLKTMQYFTIKRAQLWSETHLVQIYAPVHISCKFSINLFTCL